MRDIRETLDSLHNLVGKLVYNEADSLRKKKRTDRQKQTLVTAMKLIEKDIEHNVKRAARKVWGKECGYASLDALYQGLRKMWNSR